MTPKNIFLYEFFVFNQLEKQIFNNIIFVTTGYVVDSWLYLSRLFNHLCCSPKYFIITNLDFEKTFDF